jgi:hypothetical protein
MTCWAQTEVSERESRGGNLVLDSSFGACIYRDTLHFRLIYRLHFQAFVAKVECKYMDGPVHHFNRMWADNYLGRPSD